VKNSIKALSTIVALVPLALGSTLSQASERHLEAHEHGVSTLRLAQEDNVIVFELEAPGNDIVGFEHAAENDEQKQAIDEALSLLQKPEAMFILPAAASCVASDQEAEFEAEDDHTEFHVTWTMTCDNLASATSMTVQFFDHFDGAEELEIEALGNAGQTAIEVEKDQTSVDLSKAIGG
jgi:hypothetical protein